MNKSFSGTPALMHDINRTGVLDVIRRMGPISQSKIATILQLQPSTILRIIKELFQEELVHPIGMKESSTKGGRRATLLQLNPKGSYAIGVDLNANQIQVVLLDLVGSVVGEIRKNCSSESDPGNVLEIIISCIGELLSNQEYENNLTGIGVSFPGKVDSNKGIAIYASNFKNWKNVYITRELERVFHIPVFVEHDMRAMAFGQMWFNEECQNMLCLGFRSGIGLGIVMNGQLYRGSNQLAGDLGHIIVDPEGPLCNCGRYGCLEAISSEWAILSKFKNYMYSKDEIIANQAEISIHDLYLAVQEGNTAVLEIVEEAAIHIGKTLCDLVRIFDTEKIIVGGDIIASSPEFLNAIRTTFKDMQPAYADFVPEIITTQFGKRSIAIGAAAIMLSKSFQPNQMIKSKIF